MRSGGARAIKGRLVCRYHSWNITLPVLLNRLIVLKVVNLLSQVIFNIRGKLLIQFG